MFARFVQLSLFLSLLAGPVAAQDAEEYVRDNILAIFYHELGHALIDLRNLPIYGQEEDAADVASVMLMHLLYDEEAANQMVISTADAFLAEALEEEGDIPFWDTHGANEQRYYNTICIFYGGNPDARSDMIEVMGLPEERQDWCPTEFEQADHSWGNALAEISTDEPGESFVLGDIDDAAPIIAETIRAEVAALNKDFALDTSLPISVQSCGEPNAYYDPQTKSITMCTEFEQHLYTLYAMHEE
jgi:hypothetical protein